MLRNVALFALMIFVLLLVVGVTTGAPGALIFFVVFVPAFLFELVADPQFLGGHSQQRLSFVSEPCLSFLFERPPPFSLA